MQIFGNMMSKLFGKPRRASADYRQRLAVTLFKDTLESAWERAIQLFVR